MLYTLLVTCIHQRLPSKTTYYTNFHKINNSYNVIYHKKIWHKISKVIKYSDLRRTPPLLQHLILTTALLFYFLLDNLFDLSNIKIYVVVSTFVILKP